MGGTVNAAHASPSNGVAGAPRSDPLTDAPSTPSAASAVPDADSDWRVAVRVVPPLGRWGAGKSKDLNYPTVPTLKLPLAGSWGGVAVGAIAPNGVWMEGSASSLVATAGTGWETTMRAGYEFGSSPKPNAWTFSIPVYFGYRYANLPYVMTTDGHYFTEDMSLLVTGARLVLARSFRRSAIELGLDLCGSLPLVRSEPRSPAWRQETVLWIDAAIVLGWSTRL